MKRFPLNTDSLKSGLQPRYLPFWLALLACMTPFISSPAALAIGFTLALTGLVPEELHLPTYTRKLLSYSIIGLGFGIPFQHALAVTSDGIGIIIASIFGTLILGWIATRFIKLDTITGYLISAGTAICGGSAIAAISPAINAKDDQIGISLATVFLLNSIALFVFPMIGNTLGLDQHTFGVWAAIAIHDTSSVVGAAGAYGEEALTVATTLKLARALWIIPVTLISAAIFASINKKEGGGSTNKIAIPWFIFWYCVAIATTELLPQFDVVYNSLFAIAKKSLVVCLFLIGSNISINNLRKAGPKPLVLGVGLWIVISTASLLWVI